MLCTKQKESIEILRRIGWGYKKIAAQINSNRDEVRYYCKTHDLMGKINVPEENEMFNTTHCRTCKKAILQNTTGRKRLYCSEECRRKWNNYIQPTYYEHNCEHCGKNYKSRSKEQKYCSNECYIRNRFWRKEDAIIIVNKLLSNEMVNPPQWILDLLQGVK